MFPQSYIQMMLCVNSMTATRARIETSIPRKHGPAIAGYDKVCLPS